MMPLDGEKVSGRELDPCMGKTDPPHRNSYVTNKKTIDSNKMKSNLNANDENKAAP